MQGFYLFFICRSIQKHEPPQSGTVQHSANSIHKMLKPLKVERPNAIAGPEERDQSCPPRTRGDFSGKQPRREEGRKDKEGSALSNPLPSSSSLLRARAVGAARPLAPLRCAAAKRDSPTHAQSGARAAFRMESPAVTRRSSRETPASWSSSSLLLAARVLHRARGFGEIARSLPPPVSEGAGGGDHLALRTAGTD